MNRRERKKEETRENIITCAIGLFREKGFQKTLMEEISEKSDVSKGTLYNYFEDKESILSGYYQSIIADYGKQITANLKVNQGITARLNNLLDFISEIFGHDIELATIYFKNRMKTLFDSNPLDNPHRSGLENSVLQIMKEAQESKELRDDIQALVIARNLQFLTMSYFIASLYSEEPFKISQFKDQLIGLFLNGAKR